MVQKMFKQESIFVLTSPSLPHLECHNTSSP